MRHALNITSTTFALLIATASAGTIDQECSALDAGGSVKRGGAFSGVTATGQSGSVSTAGGGTIAHFGGFLGCFALQPNLDADQDGLSDELDGDNDNDMLSDLDETQGSSFSPGTITDLNDADSDDDGMSDGDESIAMTNPQDPNALLAITGLVVSNGPNATVTWKARGGKSYNVYHLDELDAPGSTTWIATINAAGGLAPWFETTASANHASTTTSRSYFVEIAP